MIVIIYILFFIYMIVFSKNRDSLCQMLKEKGFGRVDSYKVYIVCLIKRGSSVIGEEFRIVQKSLLWKFVVGLIEMK